MRLAYSAYAYNTYAQNLKQRVGYRPTVDINTVLYRKNCIQSIQCCICRRSKTAKKLNVINYKHEYMR